MRGRCEPRGRRCRRRAGDRLVRRARPRGDGPADVRPDRRRPPNHLPGSRTPPGGLALRRPPLGHVLATAHDMGREHAVISALGPDRRPSPAPAACAPTRGGQRRPVPTSWTSSEGGSSPQRRPGPAAHRGSGRTAGRLHRRRPARIHAVDVDAVGLGDLGRCEGLTSPASLALARPVGEVEDPRARRGGGRPRRPPRRHPHRSSAARSSTATTASTTASSATTGGRGRSSTGRSARWRPSPTPACCSFTGRSPPTRTRSRPTPPPRWRLPVAPRCSAGRRGLAST